jgi:hypothetical protein
MYTPSTVWILPNHHLVLYYPPSSLTLDGEVRRYIPTMSSHAPGEGGKNAPLQITEGPSIASAHFARSRVVITVLTSTPIFRGHLRYRRVLRPLICVFASARFLRTSYY